MNASGFIFAIAILIMPTLFIGMIVANVNTPPEYSFKDEAILSLNDGSRLSGLFFLGSGSIDEEPVFIYYKVDGKGYRLETLPADNTLIIEDEEQSPFRRTILKKTVASGRFFSESYEIHVPKGTIIRTYNLDGELR